MKTKTHLYKLKSYTYILTLTMIAAGANVNAKKLSGSTPLSIATQYNRNDIVPILKKAGAK